MAARKTTGRKKPHYVRTKKRKGAEKGVIAQRTFVVVMILVIMASILVGIGMGFRWMGRKLFSENPRFRIQHLEISCDGNLREEQIREYTGLSEGQNLFSITFDEITERLQKVPVVESVELQREMPSTLYVRVKERVPVARILIKNYKIPRLLDRYGVVLPPRASASLARLPLIKGLDSEVRLGASTEHRDIDYALDIIGLCESKKYLHNHIPIDSLDIQYSDFIDMRLTGGTRVRMPRFQLESKLFYLASVIEFSNSQGKRVKEIDLTLDTEKAPVRYY